jgi:hypothetical protein
MAHWRIWASVSDNEGRGPGETFHAVLEAPTRDDALRLAVTAQRLPVGFTWENDVAELEWHNPTQHVLLMAEDDSQTWSDRAGHQWYLEFDWVEMLGE